MTKPEPVELRECPVPWCREAEQISFVTTIWGNTYFVECLTCKARGPIKPTKEAAFAAWNARASAPEPVELPVAVSEAAFTRAEAKAIWKQHGGSQHGPNVEQYYIEEQAWYRFIADFERQAFARFEASISTEKRASLPDPRIAGLVEALAPFARALAEWGDDTGQPDRWNTWEHPIAQGVTLGDFRKAAEIYATYKEGETGNENVR